MADDSHSANVHHEVLMLNCTKNQLCYAIKELLHYKTKFIFKVTVNLTVHLIEDEKWDCYGIVTKIYYLTIHFFHYFHHSSYLNQTNYTYSKSQNINDVQHLSQTKL